jgi:hypothetical protein
LLQTNANANSLKPKRIISISPTILYLPFFQLRRANPQTCPFTFFFTPFLSILLRLGYYLLCRLGCSTSLSSLLTFSLRTHVTQHPHLASYKVGITDFSGGMIDTCRVFFKAFSSCSLSLCPILSLTCVFFSTFLSLV